MNRAQIIVLGVTVVAFGGAYVAFNSLSAPSAPPQVTITQAPSMALERVLVAAADIPRGGAVNNVDTQWNDWPKAATSDEMILQSVAGPSPDEIKGAIAREAILKGEPIRKDRIVRADTGGLTAATLPAGKRAIAIPIDNNGTGGPTGQPGQAGSGSFIVPGDHVDVIRIYRDEDATKAKGIEVVGSETIVENVRVIAISGSSATLELDPKQAELVILAQRQGNSNLHLALRSLLDDAGDAKTVTKTQAATGGLTVVRFGSASSSAK